MAIELQHFVADVNRVFAALMSEHRFVLVKQDSDEEVELYEGDGYASCTYRCDERYIKVLANSYIRDGQPDCRVILGHGPDEFPETDWNSIALWQLDGEQVHYPFARVEEIPSVLQIMCSDLRNKAGDFLVGDVDRFLQALRDLNRHREPYKIYSPKPDGTYEMTFDPKSVELKDRYS